MSNVLGYRLGKNKRGRNVLNNGREDKEMELYKSTQRAYSELAVHLGTRERKSGRKVGQGSIIILTFIKCTNLIKCAQNQTK